MPQVRIDDWKKVPLDPGVYLMKDARERVIYVGKARSLRNRVRSYFQNPQRLDAKTQVLVPQIQELEYIVTDSEVEALILECNLIKRHHPKYNIRLRDDKQYPFIKVTLGEEYPRLLVVRTVKKDGARYFGPYTDVGAMRETLRLLEVIFPLRSCKQKQIAPRGRPCLNAHIKRCLAPCSGEVSSETYQRLVQQAMAFLEGRTETVLHEFKAQMEAAAAALEFERAAELRNQMQALQAVQAKQKITTLGQEDQDVVGLALGEREAVAQVFCVRDGKMVGRDTFWLKNTQGTDQNGVLTEFLKQYYYAVEMVPPTILLPQELPGEEGPLLEQWLTHKGQEPLAGDQVQETGRSRLRAVKLRVPQRGSKKQLVNLAQKNAQLTLDEQARTAQAQQEQAQAALLGLQNALQLPRVPQRIEGYDISNFQGGYSVGSMVVMEEGKPQNTEYRHFQIKTVEGPNDFASLQEVLRRRFVRGLKEQAAIAQGEMEPEQGKFARFPDLLIIDGGKGQLQAVYTILTELRLTEIPVFGLAKRFEQLYRPQNSEPIVFASDAPELHLLQRLRDEAHRFALSYHRLKRQKGTFRSILDEIPGIGPKRKQKLLKHFGSVKVMEKASQEEFLAVPGLPQELAHSLWRFFQDADFLGKDAGN